MNKKKAKSRLSRVIRKATGLPFVLCMRIARETVKHIPPDRVKEGKRYVHFGYLMSDWMAFESLRDDVEEAGGWIEVHDVILEDEFQDYGWWESISPWDQEWEIYSISGPAGRLITSMFTLD